MREILVNDMQPLECSTADVALVHIGDEEQLHPGRDSISSMGDGAKVGVDDARHVKVGVVGALQVGKVRVVAVGDGGELRDQMRG